MIASVLHAVGFAPPAVAAAAAIAAAVAVANHSAADRGPPTTHIRDVAWNATRSAVLSTHSSPLPHAPSPPPLPSTPPDPSPNAITRAASHPSPNDYASAVAASHAIFPALAHVLRTAAARLDAFSPADYFTTPPSATSDAHEDSSARSSDHPTENADSNANSNPPAGGDGAGVSHSATNVARSSRVDGDGDGGADGGTDGDTDGGGVTSGAQPQEEGYALLGNLASAANALSATNALFSTLLPDSSRVAAAANPPLNRTSPGTQPSPRAQDVESGTGLARQSVTGAQAIIMPFMNNSFGATPDPTQGDGNTHDDADVQTRVPSVSDVNSRQNTPTDGQSELNENARSTEPSDAPTDEMDDHHHDDSPLHPADAARNAEFVTRLLSCYFASILNEQPLSSNPLPGENEGWTAARLLDEVYAPTGSTPPPPPCRGMLVLHAVMDMISPREFDAVCRGDMSSLAQRRHELWRTLLLLGRDDLEAIDENELDNPNGVDDLLNDVYDGIHEFLHQVQRELRRMPGVGSMGEDGFCDVVMQGVHYLAGQLIEIFNDDRPDRSEERRQIRFAENLSSWFSQAAGTLLAALAHELNVTWDQLTVAMRLSLASVGGYYFGTRYAVLASLVGNVMMKRAKPSFDREMAEDTWLDNDDDEPEIEENPDSSQNQNAANEAHPSPSPPSPRPRDVASLPSRAGNTPMSTNKQGDDDLVDLDEAELDALAMELVQELEPEAGGDDLEELAKELEAEHNASTRPSSSSSTPSAILPPYVGARTGVAASASVAGPFRSGMTMGSGLAPTGTSNRGWASALASTVAPRPTTSMMPTDEFSRALGPRESSRWRRVVDADEVRVNSASHGPLSRAYRGISRPVTRLDESSATAMVTENARSAAVAARLPESSAQNLQRVAAECGPQYLREVEKAITSRLSSDPDFDAARFPNAAERFLSASK